MFRSLGLRTEHLVMQGISEFIDKGDYVIQRTESEPDFWFGNSLIFRTQPTDPEQLIADFNKAFPKAKHICLQWDVGLPDLGWFADNGFEIDHAEVLVLHGGVLQPKLPENVVSQPILGDTMWEDVVALGLETGIEEGYEAETYHKYLQDRAANRMRQVKEGKAGWFGAYENEHLVASMGVVMGERLIRFQDVQTRQTHRRQGICAGLLGQVCTWALQKAPSATPVIIAEANSDAGRIYRRAGFVLSEQISSVLKRPA